MTSAKNRLIHKTEHLRSDEGTLFLIGCYMLILWTTCIAMLWHYGYAIWLDILMVSFTHLLTGRAVSIAQGTHLGLPSYLIALIAWYCDVMMLLIVYPVLIFGYKNLFERQSLQKKVKQVFDSAQKTVPHLRRFKIIGVFMFVWFPFWMTGIIMGAILGFLLGLRTWVNIITVSLGSCTAIICWVYAYDKIFDLLKGINESIPLIITIMLIVTLIIIRFIKNRRDIK